MMRRAFTPLFFLLLAGCGTAGNRAPAPDSGSADLGGGGRDFVLPAVQRDSLRRFDLSIRKGRWEEAARTLRGFGEPDRPLLYRPDPERARWVNLWDHLHREFRDPPIPLASAYRREFNARVAEEFKDARDRKDLARLSHLVDVHFLARGHRGASELLLNHAIEGSYHSTAVRVGARLLRERPPEKWEAPLVARVAWALYGLEREETIERLRRKTPELVRDGWVMFAGKKILLEEVFLRLLSESPLELRAPFARLLVFQPFRAGPFEIVEERPVKGGPWMYRLRRKRDGRELWSAPLCETLESGRVRGSTGWVRAGRLLLLFEGRLLFEIETLTGRVNWVRSMEDVVGGLRESRIDFGD